MKKTIIIIGAVVVVGLIAWGIWFFAFSGRSQGSPLSNIVGFLPGVSPQNTGSVQHISSPEDPTVAKDFLDAIQNADQITLGGTVIVSPYALQIWGDANKGGEALLKNVSGTGWKLVSLGGGEWNVLALIQAGVPPTAAEQLVAGLASGASAPIAPQVSIPTGDTITIGTAKGSVTVNNFYKSAVYIARDQKAVVIQQASAYNIVYDVSGSSFSITILLPQFEAPRQIAEAAFLNSLGVSEQDACKLTVYESILGDASNQYVSRSLPLSFCN